MRLLLDAGADPNLANNFDATPLGAPETRLRSASSSQGRSRRPFEARPHAARLPRTTVAPSEAARLLLEGRRCERA
jgi:hypothetical protein